MAADFTRVYNGVKTRREQWRMGYNPETDVSFILILDLRIILSCEGRESERKCAKKEKHDCPAV